MNSLFFSPSSHFFTTSQTTMSSLLPTAAAAARAPPQHRQPDTGYPNNNGGDITAEDKFERFERWLRENGAYFPVLELREYDSSEATSAALRDKQYDYDGGDADAAEEKKDAKSNLDTDGDGDDEHGRSAEESEMRGVHCTSTLPPNSVCVAVPRKCLVTVEMGQQTPIGQAILMSDLDLDAPKHIFLMIYLLWDRKVNGPRSFFAPYYDILPPTLSNMPIFWSDDELAELTGSYLLAQIADRNEAIAEDYHAICDIAPELADIATLDEFKWARMCVCSRNFGLQIDGHRTSALVPYADMLNHYRPRETKWTFDDEREAFTITTLQSIPAGAQVYDSYGQKCNHRFLLNYGFAVEDNREIDGFCPNEVPLELTVPPDDPLYEARMEFWTRGEDVLHHGSGGGGGGGVAALAAAVQAAANAGREMGQDPSALVESALRAAAAARERNHHLSGRNGAIQAAAAVKRVRICVSNNENTRAMFSMLRVLACNEVELRAISTAPTAASNGGGDSSCSNYVSRALLGLANANTGGQEAGSSAAALGTGRGGSAASSSSPPPISLYRSCRDIRHPLNVRNEKAAMALLIDIITDTLQTYPTSLAQDIMDLVDESEYPRFSNKRHAKIQVRGEKEVLHHFAQWAKAALDVLDVIEMELAIERGDVDEEGNPLTIQDPRFDYVIRAMEDEESSGGDDALHHTIVRYCADVLDSLRREELKIMRRIRLATTRSAERQGQGY